MLKKVETKCKRCKNEFCKKRTEQEFCSAQCRNAAWKKSRKDASRVPVAPREEFGSPVIGITQRLSIMIVSGGSTQRNFFVRGSDAPKQSPGCQCPRHYADPSLSLVAMTQFETLISHLMRLVMAYLGHDLGLCRR